MSGWPGPAGASGFVPRELENVTAPECIMLREGTVLIAATRQAVLVASAAVAIASVGFAQTTYKLTIPTGYTVGPGYLGTAQVTSTPAGIDCRSEASGDVIGGGVCSFDFPAGTVVTLTATPLYGGTLDGWVNACAGQGATTCQLEMTQALMTSPKVIARTFTLTIRGTGNASGVIFNIDRLARPPLLCSIGPGGVTKGTCETQFPAFQRVNLSSDHGVFVSATRYFGCGTEPYGIDCRFVMDGPRTVLAGWLAPEIIVYGGGDGAGTVTGGTPGHVLNCAITGTDTSGACSVIWDQEPPPNSVTLTATPTGNSVFAGWSGRCSGTGPCVVFPTALDSFKVTATFTVPSHVVSIASAGSGSGTVTSNPAKLDCVITNGAIGDGCSTPFASGAAVTLTADPTGGSTFGGWTGACSGAQPACAIVVNADTRVTARFVAPRPAAELAQALLGSLTLSSAEQRELDRYGNKDGTYNLGDLLALLARTGERVSAATMNALLAAPHGDTVNGGSRRIP